MTARWLLLPFSLGLCVWLTQCAGFSVWDDGKAKKKDATDAVLEERLSPEWIKKAKVIRMTKQTIYYQGEAKVAGQTPLDGWAGTITGEILVLTPRTATTCTEVIVAPFGGIRIKSKSKSYVKPGANEWQHLVQP